jgi:RNA polymerase sigma-70 factor (ECF subfamily)
MQKEKSLQELGLDFYNRRDESSFTKLYYRLKPGVAQYLKDYVKEYSDREEVIASAFAKVWSKIHQYDPYWNFSTWVYRIARNEALLSKRYTSRNYSYEGMEEMGINMQAKGETYEINSNLDEYQEDIEVVLCDMIADEIPQLPEVYSTVLKLREIEKMKYEDIANQLGWKINTVRTRIHKARELVRNSLKSKHPELVKMYTEKHLS